MSSFSDFKTKGFCSSSAGVLFDQGMEKGWRRGFITITNIADLLNINNIISIINKINNISIKNITKKIINIKTIDKTNNNSKTKSTASPSTQLNVKASGSGETLYINYLQADHRFHFSKFQQSPP